MAGNSIAIQQVRVLLEGATRRGVSAEPLLYVYGIDPSIIQNPDARIEKHKLIHLMPVIMRQAEDEFMGLGG